MKSEAPTACINRSIAKGDLMKKKLALTAAFLAAVGMVLSIAPDIKRYIKITTM
jgi:hypothetical protein